jgi:hypothetical protein
MAFNLKSATDNKPLSGQLSNHLTKFSIGMTVDGQRGAVAPDLIKAVKSLCNSGLLIGDGNPSDSYNAEMAADAVFNTELGLTDESHTLHKKSATSEESGGGKILFLSMQSECSLWITLE